MRTYDPKTTSIICDNQKIVGYGGSTFLKAERNSDAATATVGTDGLGCRTLNADKSGTMEITVLRTSPANRIFEAMAARDELNGAGISDFQFKDGTSGLGVAHASEAWVKKRPPLQRDKEEGEVTWILETLDLDIDNSPAATDLVLGV